MTRVIVIGLGAIGGTIAARLDIAGVEVLGVARGAHRQAVEEHGLTLRTPVGLSVARIPVVGQVSDIAWRRDVQDDGPGLAAAPGDIVILAVKSQDTAALVDELAACAPAGLVVVCAQNGVTNEAVVGARLPAVIGCVVMLPAAHLVPGEVSAYSEPVPGMLDLGAPEGSSASPAQVAHVASLLRSAGFDSRELPDVMRWKHGKLLMNLGNVEEVILRPGSPSDQLSDALRAEGRAVLEAADIPVVTDEEDRARRGATLKIGTIGGQGKPGSSTWQSLHRGLPLETDYLNGHIATVAAEHGLSAPLNLRVTELAREVRDGRLKPASLTEDEVLALDAGPRTDDETGPATRTIGPEPGR